MTSFKKYPAVFLDRDGTIIRDRNYLKDPGHIQFYKGVFGALKALRASGYKLVMITNQSGIGRGILTHKDLEYVHQELQTQLEKHGVWLDGIYVCHHRPEARCSCRKPQAALFFKARRDLAIDMKNSYLVGDRLSDVRAAPRLGAQGVLVRTGLARTQHLQPRDKHRFHSVRNFSGAALWILKRGKRDTK